MEDVRTHHPFVKNYRYHIVGIILMAICLVSVHCSKNSGTLKVLQAQLETLVLPKPDNLGTFTDAIVLKDVDGNVILDKSLETFWQQPLRTWDYKHEMLTHIHIVKTSGTSLDFSLLHSLHRDGCGITCSKILDLGNRSCPCLLNSYCCKHFDWTQVETIEKAGIQTAPLVILRNPAHRTASHFYYMHQWDKTAKISAQNFSEFLQDPEALTENWRIWFDGQVTCKFINFINTRFHCVGVLVV